MPLRRYAPPERPISSHKYFLHGLFGRAGVMPLRRYAVAPFIYGTVFVHYE
jgi:hypothetical protein